MALKPTIYKLRIDLSDLERNYYQALKLTVAQHPSETAERMMARVLAFAIHAQDEPEFTKGLSTVEEPDIWVRSMDDQITLWIDVGEPSVDRITKAARLARRVVVYSFNSKSEVWWAQNQAKLWRVNASIYRFDSEQVESLAALLERTMDFSITITGDSAYFATQKGECEVSWSPLQIV